MPVTGLPMVRDGDPDLTQFRLLAALVLYGVAVSLGLFVFTPTLSNQISPLPDGWPRRDRVQVAVPARDHRRDRARHRRDRKSYSWW